MMNQVFLIGRLTDEPELRYTQGEGLAVAEFTLAVDRGFNSDDADFINITTWRKQAESCSQYLKKGSLAAVAGRLRIESYTDSEGVRRKAAKVIASEVKFLDKKGSDEPDF